VSFETSVQLVYGFRINEDISQSEEFEATQELIREDRSGPLELVCCGDCCEEPALILAFRNYGYRQTMLDCLPIVEDINQIALPGAAKLELARKFLAKYDLAWVEPDWYFAVTFT